MRLIAKRELEEGEENMLLLYPVLLYA